MKTIQNRRKFIGTTASAAAGLGFGLGLNASIRARAQGANEKVIFGVIGCGGMGRDNTRRFMALRDVEIAAVCDVDSKHMDQAADEVVKAGRPAPKKFKDFRALLGERDINAVIISTPDHWHALPFIAACEAGKDIYCEKPISHNFVEAKSMMNAARRFSRVVQVGTWQRSVKHFQDAIEFVRSGKLGEITVCRAWSVNSKGGWLKSLGRQTPEQPPAHLDWDFWLGPAPKRPYTPNRAHFSWRWFFDYGGGLMTDWGVHMIDIVLLGMQQWDPVHVAAAGGKFAFDDDRDTPDTMQALYQFPKFILQWENRFNNGRGLDGGKGHGAEFIGSNGTLIVDRKGYEFYPEKPEHAGPPPLVTQESTHWQNFLDCVKSRNKPASDIESMAKTTMLCHLGNIAWQSGRTIRWDATKQDVAERESVRNCISYQREYRKPWSLKIYQA